VLDTGPKFGIEEKLRPPHCHSGQQRRRSFSGEWCFHLINRQLPTLLENESQSRSATEVRIGQKEKGSEQALPW